MVSTMNTPPRTFGQWGEDWACDYLVGLGWRILDRNWRDSLGELDVVALDPAARALVAVEVKTRRGSGYGDPLAAISRRKLNRLGRLLVAWRSAHPGRVRHLRVDGIGIVKAPGRAPVLTHLRGLT